MENLTAKRKIGNLGEDLACKFITKNGFNILERNYLKKCGEIDIIAKNKEKLHFIEVKSVSCEINPVVSPETNNNKYRPEDNVHPWKLERLSKTIQLYLIERKVSDEMDWQLDIITVYIDKNNLKAKIGLIENVIFN